MGRSRKEAALPITNEIKVVACHIRWPMRLAVRTIYRLITEDGGDFVASSAPDIFDGTGQPIALNRELARGAVVRVEHDGRGGMTAIQLVVPLFVNPFARLLHRMRHYLCIESGRCRSRPENCALDPETSYLLPGIEGVRRETLSRRKCRFTRESATPCAAAKRRIITSFARHPSVQWDGRAVHALESNAGRFVPGHWPDIANSARQPIDWLPSMRTTPFLESPLQAASNLCRAGPRGFSYQSFLGNRLYDIHDGEDTSKTSDTTAQYDTAPGNASSRAKRAVCPTVPSGNRA
jgi:hypothetical protein